VGAADPAFAPFGGNHRAVRHNAGRVRWRGSGAPRPQAEHPLLVHDLALVEGAGGDADDRGDREVVDVRAARRAWNWVAPK
jgi:hypothetical protein